MTSTTVSAPSDDGTVTCSEALAISMVGAALVTCTARSPDDTVTLTFFPLVETCCGLTFTVSCEPVSVDNSTTDESLTTYTDDGSGKSSEISSESAEIKYSGFTTTLLQTAERIGRTVTPARLWPLAGLYVPCDVVNDQFLVVERINSIEDFVAAFFAQNGHVASSRALNGVRSTSPGPPVQAHTSLAGSTPEKENFHWSKAKSNRTVRLTPGQFES